MTAIEMRINGIPVPVPKVDGVVMKKEKIWSQNTGRTAAGTMQGTIVAIKTTWSITWPPLTVEEVDFLLQLISDPKTPFPTIELTMPNGIPVGFTCYFGTPSFTLWNRIGGTWRCTDAKVDAIER